MSLSSLIAGLLLTFTDVSKTCAIVINVKMRCVSSVDGIKFW